MDRVQKAIESQYKGLCDVYEKQSVTVNHKTEQKIVKVLENIPCKLSYSTVTATTEKKGVAQKDVTTKLFLSPNIVIKPGSKITVTQNGVTTDFSNSGEPAHFSSHQEIELKLFERWA